MSELEQHRSTERDIPQDIRWAVLERDDFQCQFCGTSGENRLQLHHWAQWRSAGVDHRPENLVTVCAWDHERIHARRQDIELREVRPGEWRAFRWLTTRRR